MSVEISDENWRVLDLTTRGGINEDDVAYSINAYREEGKSDEEIQQIVDAKIAEKRPQYEDLMRRLKASRAEFENRPDIIELKRQGETLDKIEPLMAAVHGAGRAMNTMSFGLGDTLAAGIDWTANQVGVDTGLIESIKEGNERYPILTNVTEIGGVFMPGGAIGKAIKYGAKAGKAVKGFIVGEKAARTAKTAGYLAEVGIRSAAAEGAFQIEENMKRVAGTEDWKEGQTILSTVGDAGTGTLANMGLDMIFGGVGAGFRKIKQVVNATDSTVALLGGKENVINARKAFEAAKASGLDDVTASGAFFAKIAEGVSPEQSEQIARMIQKSPRFRAIAMQQIASGENFVYNTADALTNAEKGKAAQNINEYLGSAYTDAIGARQLGTTSDDLVKYMGVNSPNFQEIKSAGLAEAQENVLRRAPEFEDDVRFAGNILRTDKAATDVIIDSAEVANFSALQPGGHAEKMMATYLDKKKAQYIENGLRQMGEVAPEQQQVAIAELSARFDNEVADSLKKQYAQKFTENIIKNGTDNVYDLMDMQNHVKNVMKKDVMQGGSTAPGTYHKEINRLLGSESKILDGSLKAMSNADDMVKMHQLGESFKPTDITGLENALAGCTDAKEAATKLAGFKLGFENKLLNAMISGDSQAFVRLKAMTEKPGVLSKFFEEGELQKFAQQSAPKVIAANNLRTWMKATGKYEGNATLIDAVIRTFIAGAAGARVAGANAAVTTARKISFGPKTMSIVEEFASNPSAENFNKMIRSAKDTTERNLMLRVVDSLGDGINQYLITAGKMATEGEQ